MNEQIVSAALKTLNISADEVSGDLTDEKITEIIGKINSSKVFTEDMLQERDKNTRSNFRTTIENEVKGKAFESLEKELKQKYGLDIERGKDYQNAIELVGIIQSQNSSDEQLKNDLDAARNTLGERTKEFESKLQEANQSWQNKMNDMVLGNEVNKFASRIDAEDEHLQGQLGFLKYNFDQRYELKVQDGKTVVFDKQTQDVVKNETSMHPETVSNVLEKLAPQAVRLKEATPKRGRKEEDGKPVGARKSAMAKFESFDEVLNSDLGKDITNPNSEKGQMLYAEWKNAKGEAKDLVTPAKT